MISNQWFTEVVKIFASHTIFEFGLFDDMMRIVLRLPTYFQQNITTIHWGKERRDSRASPSEMQTFSRALPSLKILRVFREPPFSYSHQSVTTKEMERTARHCGWVRCLRTLRGLEEFHYVGNRYADQVPKHAANLDAWEEWMRAEVTKPKGT